MWSLDSMVHECNQRFICPRAASSQTLITLAIVGDGFCCQHFSLNDHFLKYFQVSQEVVKYRHYYTFYSYPGFELICEAKVYNNGLIFQKKTLI